jgi:oligopeptide transport system ATP-binding protein
VTIYVRRGETLGLVGESGCGKSTLARVLLYLVEPTLGRVHFDGKDLARMSAAQLRATRRRMQIVFQSPSSSLNPRMTVYEVVAEGLIIHRLTRSFHERKERVEALLAELGLGPDVMDHYPHELSTGQRQRVGIARALAVGPDFVVCDEPVNALDPSLQAEVLNLLETRQANHGLGMLYMSHDLRLVAQTAHRVAVMHLGRIVEMGPTRAVFETPRHPYTRALLSAARPSDDPQRRSLAALSPSAVDPPPGCAFHPRCPRFARGLCDVETPTLVETAPETHHRVACFRPEG